VKISSNCEDLMNTSQSIPEDLHRQTEIEKNEHLVRLNAAIDICGFLMH
jgi:hypothetical protein